MDWLTYDLNAFCQAWLNFFISTAIASYPEGAGVANLLFGCISAGSKRTARSVLTGMCYSACIVKRQGSSSLLRLPSRYPGTSTWIWRSDVTDRI